MDIERQLAVLLRLVRERRLEEANAVLAEVIGGAPEVATRWLVLARLLLADAGRWEGELQGALGQLGAAPLAAYRQAVRVLESLALVTSVTVAIPDGAGGRVAALEGFRVALTRYRERGGGAAVSPRIAALEGLRTALLAHAAAWRFSAPERRVARLEALAVRLVPASAGSGVPSGQQVIDRLERFAREVGG